MTDINTVVIAGRLVKNAEFRQVGQSDNVRFTIAVNRSRKEGEEWKDEVSFIDVQGWGLLASRLTGKLPKGIKVTVSGSLKQERWEQNGEKRSRISITADQVDVHAAPQKAEEDCNGF